MKINEILQPKTKFWYHGTNERAWKKIQKEGFLKPRLADYYAAGKAVFFTSSKKEAKEFADFRLRHWLRMKKEQWYFDEPNPGKGIVLSINANILKNLKYIRTAPAEILVKDKIPVRDITVIT